MTRSLRVSALSLSLLFSACAAQTPPPEEPLLADPPLSGQSGIDSSVAQTELSRGVAYYEEGKIAEAKEHFQKAIAAAPKLADAHAYLGICNEQLGDKLGAEDAYKQALSLDPKLGDAAQNLGAMLLEDPARLDEAITVLADAAKVSPGHVGVLTNLAYAYARKKDLASAGPAFQAALAKADSPELRLAYAELLLAAGKDAEAAEQLKKALAAAKDDVPMLASLGRLLGEAKAYGDCVAAWDRALKLKADEAEFYVRRGVCRHELGDEQAARKDYEAAIAKNPSFAAAHYYLGMSYAADKRRAQAIAALDKAKKFGEGTRFAELADKKLKELSRP
jgi:Tfp pilus assembly protein PilF